MDRGYGVCDHCYGLGELRMVYDQEEETVLLLCGLCDYEKRLRQYVTSNERPDEDATATRS